MRKRPALRRLVPVVVFLWACCAVPAASHAQSMGGGPFGLRYGNAQDVFALSFTDIEPSGVRSPGTGENGTLQSQETRVSASVPVYGRGTDTVWSAGVFGENLNLQFKGFSSAINPALISELYGEGISGGVFHRFNEDRGIFGYVSVGEFSDGSYSQNGLRESGGAIYQLRLSPTSTVGLGGGVTYVFGAGRLVPIVTYAYRDAPWSADVVFPFRADFRYALSEWVRIGGEFFAQGGEFSVDNNNPSAPVDTVQYSTLLLGGVLSIGRLSGPQFQLEAGSTLYRHYAALDSGTTVEALSFYDSAFYRAGIVVRF